MGQIEFLRYSILENAMSCADENLLDFISKLFINERS